MFITFFSPITNDLETLSDELAPHQPQEELTTPYFELSGYMLFMTVTQMASSLAEKSA